MNLEQLAREAGLTDPDLGPWMIDYGNAEDAIKRFAGLVLEEAAKVCDSFSASTLAAQKGPSDELPNVMLRQLAHLGYGEAASAIRALAAQKV